jgi:toxin HigB-1
MIEGFRCKATEALFLGRRPAKHLRAIAKAAQRKLDMIDYAEVLDDLRVPGATGWKPPRATAEVSIASGSTTSGGSVLPGGDGPDEVEIVDYH